MIGHEIVVTVLSISRDQVRLGIEAPADVEVHREEVYRSIQQANRAAAAGGDIGQLAGVLPAVRAGAVPAEGRADAAPPEVDGPGGAEPGASDRMAQAPSSAPARGTATP